MAGNLAVARDPDWRLDHLDLLRGGAALLVLAGHLRSYVFTNYSSLGSTGLLVKLFYAVTGLGHQAVVIFFAMSGFLVGGKALEQMLAGRWHWQRYILRRLVRLWIVIIPALFATLLLDHLGMMLNGGLGYDGSLYSLYVSGPERAAPANYDITTFLGNIAFIQKVWVPIFGSNAPIWSLANEFWYYLVFPLAASLALVRYGPRSRVIAAALLLLAVFLLPQWLLVPGAIWVAGAMAAWISKQQRLSCVLRSTSLRLLSSALMVTALVLTKTSMSLGDLAFGLTVAVLLPVIAVAPSWGRLYRSSARGAAEISYTLYLTHFPLLTLIVMAGLAPHRFVPGAAGAGIYLGLLILAVGWASGFWWCFERHTDRVFYYLSRRLPMPASAAAISSV